MGMVNQNCAGCAQFVELPNAGHTFEHYATTDAAFVHNALPFDASIAGRITAWFDRHR